MLNAILKSKSGRVHSGEDQRARWLDLFRRSEDLLTATVLERLAYLPAKAAWSLLVEAAPSQQLRPYRVAELTDIQFWPMWKAEDRKIGVEPDVFLAFELGDPAQRVAVILEAKLGDMQREGQWEAEVGAWAEAVSVDEVSPPDILMLLAVGGNMGGERREERLSAFIEKMRCRHTTLPELIVVEIEWADLARACARFESENSNEERIVTDIREGLRLCGFPFRTKPNQWEVLSGKPLSAKTLVDLMESNRRARNRERGR